MDDLGAAHRGRHRQAHRGVRRHCSLAGQGTAGASRESAGRSSSLAIWSSVIGCWQGKPNDRRPASNDIPLSTSQQSAEQPHLVRALGRRDLVLLFVVAVFNLNVVPSIAANGGVTVWLWIISLLLFFWPQGIAVIELAHRYPGEGGVYLWAKEVFGDFHGFLSGWCYWTNNMLYVPTVM